MIRINLLKPLQQPEQKPILLEEAAGGKKRALILLAGVIVVAAVVAFLQYPSLLSGLMPGGAPKPVAMKKAHKPKPAAGAPTAAETAKAAAEAAVPKRVTAQAVEEIVHEIQADPARKDYTPTYAELVPSEKIEFQYFACTHILKDIKAVTPPDVGFANFIFTPPGDFYVHGLAYDEQSYERFKAGLDGLEGASVRPGMAVKAGVRGTAKEFSFYGTVKYPINAAPTPPDRVVSKARLEGELRQMHNVASSLGFRLQNPKLLASTAADPSLGGHCRKMVFQAAADCNYQQMQNFISQLYESKSNLGVVKFSLHANGDEKVVADLDILAYVN